MTSINLNICDFNDDVFQGLNYSVVGGGALFCGHWNEHTNASYPRRSRVGTCTMDQCYKLWPI